MFESRDKDTPFAVIDYFIMWGGLAGFAMVCGFVIYCVVELFF